MGNECGLHVDYEGIPFIIKPSNRHGMQELDSVKALRVKGVDFRLIELSHRAVSVDDVVRYSLSEIAVDEICKTILLNGSDGGTHAALLLGSHRVDFKKVRDLIGVSVRIATFEEVKVATGVEPGAVCPILLSVPLLVDSRVLAKEKINFGSGHHLYGLEIDPKDLEKVVEYHLVDIAEAL
jgi:prolyl-tRNA editing enzyme YbaK/EbsC (Cys-tRNA(Pro) deacylase)